MASADDNVRTVQAIYEAFGKADIDAILAHVTDDVDWATEAASADAAWYGPRKGKDGVASFFRDIAAAVDVLEFAPVSFAANDSEVMAFLTFRMAAKSTGREAAMHLQHYWRLRDGKVEYYRGSEDTAQTVAALDS